MKTYRDIIDQNYVPQNIFSDILKRTDEIIQENHLEKDHIDITDAPISPFLFLENDMEVIMSDEVTEQYYHYIKLINDPTTAYEYSLLLLGRLKEHEGMRFYVLEKMIDCALDQKQSARTTNYDLIKLESEIKKAIEEGYNFISFCHTHPKIAEEETKTTIATYLTEEEKDRFGVRSPGLNLSLQDLINYDSLYHYIRNPYIKTAETVIMYNQDVTIVSRDKEDLTVYGNVFESREFRNVSVIASKEKKMPGINK